MHILRIDGDFAYLKEGHDIVQGLKKLVFVVSRILDTGCLKKNAPL
jgi:hypothetical protein